MNHEILDEKIFDLFAVLILEKSAPKDWHLIWDEQSHSVVTFGFGAEYVIGVYPWAVRYSGPLFDINGAATPWPYIQNHQPIKWRPKPRLIDELLFSVSEEVRMWLLEQRLRSLRRRLPYSMIAQKGSSGKTTFSSSPALKALLVKRIAELNKQ